MKELLKPKYSVIFFDGHCVLCNRTVKILIKMDKGRKLKYSSLQGKMFQEVQKLQHINSSESVIFWSEGKFYQRTEAVIHILLELGGIYKMLGASLKIFPIFILDFFYNFIARNRYRLFGKKDVCLIPTDEVKDLFIP